LNARLGSILGAGLVFGVHSIAWANFTSDLTAVHSGMCVEVAGASATDGASVVQGNCVGRAHQSVFFQLVVPTTDIYTMEFVHSGSCLTVDGGGVTSGTPLIQDICSGTTAQQFKLLPSNIAGDYSLEAVDSGLLVQVRNASTGAGTELELGHLGGGNSQVFTLKSAAIQPAANAATVGQWGPVIAWPHIAVSMANLPDGRVLTWSGSERETWPRPERTYTATWDPTTGQFVDILTIGHNMFCASQVMMADGRVFVNGGRNQQNTPFVSVFDYRDNSWDSFENMASGGRWYPTTVALTDGDAYTAMGTASMPRVPERWDPKNGWTLQPNADWGQMVLNPYPGNQYRERNWWPLLNVAPSGLLFHAGPTPQMHWVNTEGLGDYEKTGPLVNGFYHKHSAHVMYDEGKILVAGGWTHGTNINSTSQAFVIDINGPAPTVSNTQPMNFPRKFHVPVILPTGEVMVVGGNTSGRKFSDAGAVLDVEFWNPQTGTWTLGAPMTIPRGYHSTATLLLDGRVLSAGGGYCSGNAHCNGSSHRDGQVFSPPYLFDSSGNLAQRPRILSAPGIIRPGETLRVETTDPIDKFTFIRMSSSTHGVNSDLRYLELPATRVSTNQYDLEAHVNPNVLTPGYWMLFAVDARGVPSKGAAVQVETTESVHANHALAGVASQSSVAPGTPSPAADNAIDGDMSGDLSLGSMARTDAEQDPWVQVDLRHSVEIHSIRLWNRTDCCQNELEDFHVFISQVPFTSTNPSVLANDPNVHAIRVSSAVNRLLELSVETTGRYVRVQKNGFGNLAVDELQVFGQDNLALAGSATQSSQYGTVAQFGPANAINGNRTGDAGSNSITHTQSEAEAWWELDLGSEAMIDEVVLWNRTDCCSQRLSNFYVLVSPDPFMSTVLSDARAQSGVTEAFVSSLSTDSIAVPVGTAGRYIRVQLTGTDPLSLAEVEVHGTRQQLEVAPLSTTAQLVSTSVSFSASAAGTPPLEYAWDFGDGTSTGFVPHANITHTYAHPGRYVVSLRVRDGAGDDENVFATQIVHRSLTAEPPSASNTLAIDADGGMVRVWNANPDNDTVTLTEAGVVLAEIAVGDQPASVAKAPLQPEVWVVNKRDATVSIIDTTLLQVVRTLELSRGSLPHGIAFAPASHRAYVALEGTEEVVRFNTVQKTIDARRTVGGRVRHVSVDSSGTRVFASRFVSPPLPDEHTLRPVVDDGARKYGGEVVALDGQLSPVSTVVLQYSNRAASEHSGPGIPNYLGPAVISPDGHQAWVPSKQDNILAGYARGGIGMTFDQTVRAVSSMFELGSLREDLGFRVDHDNASVANHAAFGPFGAYLFTSLEGNRQVAVSDTFGGTELFRFDVGRAPRGLATSPDGRTLYVHNFMDRSVSAYDLSGVVDGHGNEVLPLWEVQTVSGEALAPRVLLGKQLFHDARDDRLALDDYMACASCHEDGGQDGRVWDFTGNGEGLRNTIALGGRGDMAHGLLHWSGNFDEVQDFENQIRTFAGGRGLMTDADFLATEDLLGPPKAGLSSDLDALAVYVASLTRFPESPYRNGSLSADADVGRQLFEREGCRDCHFGEFLTDSDQGFRHDVGTLKPESGLRMGGLLDGIDTPTLRDAWMTAPYLHDGSASSLGDAVLAHTTSSLTPVESNQVAAYLQELELAHPKSGITDERVRFVPLNIFSDPIVVLGPPSTFGGHPSTMRVQNVTATGFEQFLDEWDYMDGPHKNENIGMLVIDRSQEQIGGLQAEGSSLLVNHQWARVSFARPFAVAPVVVAQIATFVDREAATTRIRNVTRTGFDVRLQEEEGNDGVHAFENVHWIAVEPGVGSFLGRPMEVKRVSGVRHHWFRLRFDRTYDAPVFLADMQTFNGGDSAALRHRNLLGYEVQIKVEEEQSRDNERWHVQEDVGYIVIGK